MRLHIALLALTVSLCLTMEGRANLIVNGGFEQPATGNYDTIPAGSSALTGWMILSGSVDATYTTFYPSFEGVQSLDLDGVSPGTIEQAFATVIGRSYALSFMYANNAVGGTNPASAHVSLSGAGASDLLMQDISHGGSTGADMNYVGFTYDFTANSTTTTLQFASLNPSGSIGGIALDAVSVTPISVPEPASLALTGTGLVALLGYGWRKRKS